jgi:hypothetical protein
MWFRSRCCRQSCGNVARNAGAGRSQKWKGRPGSNEPDGPADVVPTQPVGSLFPPFVS